MPSEPSSRALPAALWLGLSVPVIFAAHAAAIFALYAAGVSFVLLLFLTFAAAFAAYFFVVRASGVFRRGGAVCGFVAFLLAFLSCYAGVFWAFNTYGT